MLHLREKDVAPFAQAYAARAFCYRIPRGDEGLVCLSLCNASIAVAIFRRAPLASCTIDRICIRQWISALRDAKLA